MNIVNIDGGGTQPVMEIIGPDAVEYLSEHRRRAVRYMGETAILTVKHEPIRIEHGLKPYYAIYQIIRDGKLVDENDAAFEGHDSWEEAFTAIIDLLKEEIQLDHAADGGAAK